MVYRLPRIIPGDSIQSVGVLYLYFADQELEVVMEYQAIIRMIPLIMGQLRGLVYKNMLKK